MRCERLGSAEAEAVCQQLVSRCLRLVLLCHFLTSTIPRGQHVGAVAREKEGAAGIAALLLHCYDTPSNYYCTLETRQKSLTISPPLHVLPHLIFELARTGHDLRHPLAIQA